MRMSGEPSAGAEHSAAWPFGRRLEGPSLTAFAGIELEAEVAAFFAGPPPDPAEPPDPAPAAGDEEELPARVVEVDVVGPEYVPFSSPAMPPRASAPKPSSTSI